MTGFEQTIDCKVVNATAETINIAQIWTIGQLRKTLCLDEKQWRNLLRPYRIRSAHELRPLEAQEVIGNLSAAHRMRITRKNSAIAHSSSNSVQETHSITSSLVDHESNRASMIHE